MDSNGYNTYNSYTTTYDTTGYVTNEGTTDSSYLPFGLPLVPFIAIVSLSVLLIILIIIFIIKGIKKKKKKDVIVEEKEQEKSVEETNFVFDGTEQNNELIECPNCHTKVKDKLDNCFMCGTKIS